ncbi:iron complex transport system permease protein [Stackebrandtia albiflava]|uniref:Iron complex transport system permease protein n=1 Tax=Stackebrandtia albiflava TaxID=406432 RepID=A0A562V9G7_9ACTN|nr:iron chelate uptake ABC transporter family permease subunit [Stackebrandtia albiflava]TWJ14526.1 iron complex transport system permease protein [Stackebrandtia albiflava]
MNASRTAPPRPADGARRRVTRFGGLPVVLVALAVMCVLSIALGAKSISPVTVVEAVIGTAPPGEAFVLWELRGPRTLLCLAVGAALGVAGMLVQALTRNPLADPGILGVNAGAALLVAVGVVFLGLDSIGEYRWLAIAGALLVTVLVYLIGSAGRGQIDPVRLTLAGVAVAAVLQGVISALMLSDPRSFDTMRNWNAGTVASRELDILWSVLPLLAVGMAVAAAASPALNAIAMGDDVAVSLGVPVRVVRIAVVVAVTLLAGGATAATGPLVFIGLMVPHIARVLAGPDQRWVFLYSLLIGPILVLAADVLGRLVMRPGEIPVGIVTSFVGAPVLIALIRRRRAVAS